MSSAPAPSAPDVKLLGPSRVVVADAVHGGPTLSPRRRAATRAVAEALFTTASGPPDAERLDWLCDDLDHFFAHARGRSMTVFALCLFAVSILAPLFCRRLPPFRSLTTAQRAIALERMERSPLALVVFGLKAILCIVYYEHPGAARDAGYDGGCLRGAP